MKTNTLMNRTKSRRTNQAKRNSFLDFFKSAPTPRQTRRLHMESLEERRVLATYNFDNVAGTLAITLGTNEDLTISEAGGTRTFSIDSGTFAPTGANNATAGDGTATITFDNTLNLATSISVNNTGAGAGTNNVAFAGGTIATATVVVNANQAGTTSAIDFATALTTFGTAGADSVSLTANGAGITDSTGSVNTAANSATLNLTATGQAIVLDNANNFSSNVAANAVTSGSLAIADSSSIAFGAVNVTGSATINSGDTIFFDGAATIGGNLVANTGAISESAGGTLSVTGTSTLTAGANITLANAHNFGGDVSVVAGVSATLNDINALSFGGASSVGGNLTASAVGAITDTAGATIAVTGVASFSGSPITLDNAAAHNFGSLNFSSAGAVTIVENSATVLTGTNTAASLVLTSAGSITDDATADLAVTGNAALSGASITLGDQAANDLNFGNLTFISAGAVVITEDSATSLSGASTAASLALTSAGTITDAAGASIAVTGNASFTGTAITISAAATANFGSLTFNSAGAVAITEDSDTQIAGANTANSLVLTSAGAITDAAVTTVTVTTTAALSGTSISLTDNAADSLSVGGNASLSASGGGAITIAAAGAANFGSLTFSTTGTVIITEDSATALAGTSSGGAITLNSAGAITDAENDAANEITGTDLILTAVGGIGTAANPIHIAVNNLDVSNATSGGIFVTDTAGGLTLTNLGGPNGNSVNGVGGNGLIRAASPLTIAANAITSGGMTYTASDSAAVGDDLTVNSGVTVEDTSSTLTMNGGDNVIFNTASVVRAETALAINGDALGGGVADAGVGSTMNLFGTIQSDTAGITITGNADSDSITIDNNGAAVGGTLDGVIVPAGQLFTINGAGGADALTLEDGSDTTGDTYTITATTISTGGGNLFNNAPGLNYSNLETINIQNSNGPTNADGDVVTVTSLNAGTTYNVDGNNPTGLPGDILRLNPPGSINVYEIGGNYVFEFPGSGNLVATEFETIDLRPGNGILNIIGDEGQGQAGGANGGAGTDEKDRITVVGTGVGSGTLQLSHLSVPIAIPPSVTFSGVTRLNVNTFDVADSLAVTPYANNTPQGWGIETYFNEGPPILDGDLLIYNGVLGVSETIVVAPSAPEAGQVFSNNAATGTPIAVINYQLNVNIIVNGSSPAGTAGDTDTLTLRGTDPANPGTSGRDTFVADFTNTGVPGDERVVVTDSIGGANLYSLQNFTNFSTINIESLAGADTIVVSTANGLTVNIDGGLPAAGAAGVLADALVVNTPASATITQGADSTTGQVLTSGGAVVNFAAVESVAIVSGDGGTLTVNATDDNDTIAAADIGGADLVWVNDGPVIAFVNFTSLTLNGRFGSDDYSISPTGLAVTTINVNGGDPTASDSLVVNGTAGNDTIGFTPTGADAGTVTVGAAPVVQFTTTEHVHINGAGGDDALTYTSPAGIHDIELTGGPELDEGTITGTGNFSSPSANLVPLSFSNVGQGVDLTIASAGGREDRLIVNGTSAAENFNVDSAGRVRYGKGVTANGFVPNKGVQTPGVSSLTFSGNGGTDLFGVQHVTPFRVAVNGDGDDELVFVAAALATTTVDFGLTLISGSGTDVNYRGLARIVVGAGGGALIVNGTASNDEFHYTPDSVDSNRGRVTLAGGLHPTLAFTSAGDFTINSTFGVDKLVVHATAGDDAIAVSRGAAVTVQVNGSQPVILSGVAALVVEGSTGEDLLRVIEGAGGLIELPGGITFHGQEGHDLLEVSGTTVVSAIYDVGPTSDAGTLTHVGPVIQNIYFTGLEPVIDLAPGTLTVNGTNADNAINYSQGSVATNGLVSVDGFETIEFSNKTTLTLNGAAGSDSFNLNNPATPTGLTGITVNGGDPTASDTLVFNARAGSLQQLIVQPTGVGAGSIFDTIPGTTPISFTGMEHLTGVGQFADGDIISYGDTAANDVLEVTPGAVPDAGTITGHSTGAGAFAFVPLDYQGFGIVVAPFDSGAGGSDALIVNGTEASDTIAFQTLPAFGGFLPGIVVNDRPPIFFGTLIVDSITLRGLDGDDQFNLTYPLGTVSQFTGSLQIDGGNPDGGSDVVNFVGSGVGAVTIDLGAQTITEAGFGPVSLTGVEILNVDANANLTIRGAAGDETLDVSPTGANSGTAESSLADSPLINFTDAGTFTVDLLGGDNTLTVRYSSDSETIEVNGPAGTVGVSVGGPFETVNFLNVDSLRVFGNEGDDTFNVTPATGLPIFIDGGDPIGETAGDLINLLVAPDAVEAGPENDEGGFVFDAEERVSFDHIEDIGPIVGAPCVIILGTNGDDDITVIARDASFTLPDPAPVGLDGVQDFTVSVNGGIEILYINVPLLYIDALAGDDDIVFRTPAPNLAIWDVDAFVAGGTPSAVTGDQGDVLELETPGTQTVNYTPTGSDTGIIDLVTLSSVITIGSFLNACPSSPTAADGYNSSPGGVEEFVYDGEGGNDLFTIIGTAGIDTITHTPGPGNDEGSLRVNTLLGVTYQNLGPTAILTVDGGLLADTLVVDGTQNNDTISVATATGAVTVNARLPLNQLGVENLTLRGLNGDDTFNIPGSHPYAAINLEGGSPSASDTLNFTGSGGAVTVDLAASTVTEAGFGAVSFSGVEVLNVSAGAGAILVSGRTTSETLDVTPTGANTATIVPSSLNLRINTDNTSTLTVDGQGGSDTVIVNGESGSDSIAVVRGAITTIQVNLHKTVSVPTATNEAFVVLAGLGNDAITVSGAAGINLLVDGGPPSGFDTLNLINPASVTTSVFPGSTPDSGTILAPGSGFPTAFQGIEFISITAFAAFDDIAVEGTDGNDAITLGPGPIVRVNDRAPVSFSGFNDVFLPGRAGSDEFSITLSGLTGIDNVFVQGGDPTASDTVVVNGTTGVDQITYTPTSADSGTVDISSLPLVTVSAVEHLTFNGQGGNDNLNVNATVNSDLIIHTPGTGRDEGTVRVNELLAFDYRNVGPGANLEIDGGGGAFDQLQLQGTDGDDVFSVDGSGTITQSGSGPFGNDTRIPVFTDAVEDLVLNGLEGDDTFTIVQPPASYLTITVNGGGGGASDTLNYNAATPPPAAPVLVDLGSSEISQAGGATVDFAGVKTINLNANGQALSVTGSSGDDDLTVSVLSATAGTVELGLAVQQNGQVAPAVSPPLINYSGITGPLAVDLLGGEDTLVVVGNAFGQTFDVDAAGSVAIDDAANGIGNDGTVTFTNTESLEVFGLEGADQFNVTAGLIPVFIDGGDPIGVTVIGQGDTIVPIGTLGFFPGPESDEGGFLSVGAEISFDHIERIIVGPNGPCPFLILGTNADDDITVIARDASFIIPPALVPAGLDGIQDFTVSVNAGPDLIFIDEPDLFIDALNGDDDIVIRAPAPNDADWDVNVRVAGGPPSIGETNDGDRLVLETPGTDSIVFTATGPDTGNIVVDEDGDLVYTAGSTDSIITFGPFVFVCDDPVGEPIEFTYVSSPGGVELVEYDGELTDGVAVDDITINGTALSDTTTVTPTGVGPGGSGQGSFVSPGSPLFNFRGFDDFTVNGGTGGFDTVIYNATAGADIITSDADTVTLAGTDVNLGLGLDRLELYSFGGNDSVVLGLQLAGLAKTIDVGAGNDTVNLSASIDADIFGGIGDDILIGSPVADNIFGGAGNDILIGGLGADNEYGEDGNDTFGNLTLTPDGVANDPGNDFMFGGDGVDNFIWEPGDGNDNLSGGTDGADILRFFGNAGANRFIVLPAPAAPTHTNVVFDIGAVGVDAGDPVVDAHGIEQLIVSGLAGADLFTLADLAPTEVEDVILIVDAAAGALDTVTVNGRTVSDNVNITVNANGPAGSSRVNIAGLDYDVDIDGIVLADADRLIFNGNEGNDTILVDNDPNPLDLTTLFLPADVIINAGLGDDFVSGFGTLNGNEGNDTLVGGSVGQTINGGAGDDQIFGGAGADLLLGEAGEDTFVPGFDGALDSIDGGDDFDTILVQGTSANNRIDARQDGIGQVSYNVSGVNGGNGIIGGPGTESDVIVPGTVEELEILAGSGDDLIRVAHDDGLIAGGLQAFSLRFTVDGGAPGTSDRLTVTDEGLGDTTIHRVGGIAGNGSYTVGALAPVVYSDIEFASLNPINPVTGGTGADGLGTLFVFKHDPFEENNSRLNATFLGSNSAINVDPTIDPGADLLFELPGDEDWYRIVPQFNGDLDIRVFFRQQGLLLNGRAGLPGDGNLDIALYDADGLPVEIAGTGLFGTNDANDDERIRIPAVAGQTYFLRVKGAALANLSSAALNVYNVSVINTPAAVPIDLELDDVIGVATVDAAPAATATQFDATAVAPFVLSTVNDFYNGKDLVFTSGNLNGIRGRILDYLGASQTFVFAAGTFFAAPTAGSTFQLESADTGRSQLDNITRDTTPTIFLRVPNVVNVGGVATLDDVPFNGSAPGAPPDQFIGIPFVPTALPQVVNATAPGFRVAIFVTEHGTSDQGPPNNVLAGYATPVDPVNRPGLFTFTFSPNTLITELPVFPGTSETTSFFISARVEIIDPANPEQAQGYGDFAESLEIVVDTQPPPVFFGLPNDPDDGLLPGSDTGLNTNPETLNDLVTSDTTPGFFGQAEADAVIRLFIDAPEPGFPTGDGVFEPAIDFQIGFDVAEPFDGTNQYPNGYWQIDAINVNLNAAPFSPIDGLRRIFVTAEDVAGNINPEVGQVVQELEIFIDTQGPQITDVTVNAPSGTVEGDGYNLFDPKPSTDGPTPLVNSIFIEIRDLPNRVLPGFDQPAFKPDIAENPGHYLVTGDYNGIIPILDVEVFLDPAVNGQPATGRVQLIFRTAGADGVFNTSDDIGAALPDDRFTLFVNDEGIIDFAGNIGDFESNADEPHDSPPGPGEPDVLGVDGVPTGDGLPGGDFFARFTVDTRPELGVWAAGTAFLDINGNTIWDPTNLDFTNRDITHMIGYVSDDLFAGQFANTVNGVLVNDGFDKLAAYGRVGTTTFRWLIDTDNDGVANIERLDPANINGLPVSGNFALGVVGDEVGLFTGNRWHFDTTGDFRVDVSLPWTFNGVSVAGHPIVGDFDGDGLDDLGSWTDDTFSFDLSSINSVGGGLPGNLGIDGTIEKQVRFGFAGPGERPVAADMNQDGIEDVGLWMPANDGIAPRGQAEWFFLISGVTQNDTSPNVPTNLGPTITGSNDPTPGAYLANPALYGLANYTTGRIVIDPLFPNTNVVRFQPVPFGNDQTMQFGDEFALPLVGNFDPPVTSTPDDFNPAVNPRNEHDVNNDGKVNQIDLLALVNYLTVNGIGAAPSGGFVSAPFVDVNSDLFCNSIDLLVVLNYLTLNPPIVSAGAGESGGEGEGGSADEYFTELGSGGDSDDGGDDGVIDLIARR